MEQISPPTAVGSNAGLGGFFSEADIAASIMSGEQEGRAAPSKRHETKEAAIAEAGRLAQQSNNEADFQRQVRPGEEGTRVGLALG